MALDFESLASHDFEHLTETEQDAEWLWNQLVSMIQEVNRNDLLENSPTILDLGGRIGEFSKKINEQGINSFSLDKQTIESNSGANQVRADAYKMPFSDESFDIVCSNSMFDDLYKIDYSQLLPEVARILKSKGVLSVVFPNPLPISELEKYFMLLLSRGKDDATLWEKK